MRLREPAAWVALGALLLNLLLTIVAMATFEGSLETMGWLLGARIGNPVPLMALAVLVSFCVLRDRTPHARQLTLISLIVGASSVLLGLLLTFFGFRSDAPFLAALAALVPQAISVIAIGLLIKLLQLQAVPRRLPPGIGLVPHDPDSLPAPPAPDPGLQPTWQPDVAAGAAWHRAGDAAAGAPASGWGTGSSTGWQPIPTQPDGSPPPAPLQDPWVDQGQRKSQQPAPGWWGHHPES